MIDFGRSVYEEVQKWPDLPKILDAKVRPERLRLKSATSSASLKERWWQFAHHAPQLYGQLQQMRRCLVNSQVSKHLVYAFQPTDRVFAHTLYGYPLDAYSSFSVLQSRVHDVWARLLSSSMGTTLRYAASDCFETFPFPEPDPRTIIDSFEAIGEKLYETRAAFMVDTDQGLTKTYNALKEPENDEPRIVELRHLHEQMDRAVLDAYGWSDVEVPPFCPKTDADRTALQQFEDEVIDRLYVLNAERAAEEERLGLTKKGKKKPAKEKTSKRGKSSGTDEQEELF